MQEINFVDFAKIMITVKKCQVTVLVNDAYAEYEELEEDW